MDQYVDLLTGYQPGRLAEARKIAELLARPSDTLRVGPNLTLAHLRDVASFTKTQPIDAASLARVVVIDLDGTRRNVQTALLRTLEEPAPNIKYILVVAEESTVLETIRSRCQTTVFRPTTYAAAVKDLSQSGMSLQSAAKSATGIMSGLDLSNLPDDQAIMRAKTLIEEVQKADIAASLRLALDFEPRDIEALRQELLVIGAVKLVESTYDAADPASAAMRVVIAALGGKK